MTICGSYFNRLYWWRLKHNEATFTMLPLKKWKDIFFYQNIASIWLVCYSRNPDMEQECIKNLYYSIPNYSNEITFSSVYSYLQCRKSTTYESLRECLSNHDNDGDENVKNFMAVLVLSMKWNDLFCHCVNDVKLSHKFSTFAFLSLKHRFHFNAMKLRKRFASIMALNN